MSSNFVQQDTIDLLVCNINVSHGGFEEGVSFKDSKKESDE
jgi:hypothetical protein